MLAKALNFLMILAVIFITAILIRIITFLIIGIPNERTFSNGVVTTLGICVLVILSRYAYFKSLSNNN